MTQKEKQLLIMDILGRLLYGLKFESYDNIPIVEYCICDKVFIHEQGYVIIDLLDKDSNGNTLASTSINLTTVSRLPKPYLRPMSSMTEDEKHELYNIRPYFINSDGLVDGTQCNTFIQASECQDWLNKNQFDYRGLIPMGLALAAKEGMYKNE